MTRGKPGRRAWIFLEDVEVEGLAALELVGAVAGADGARRASRSRVFFTKSSASTGFVRHGVPVLDLDVLLDAAEHAELGLDGESLGVGRVDDALGDRDVLVERLVRGVDHHRAVEARLDAVVAGLLVAVVEVHGEDRLGEDLAGRADDRLEHPLVGVFARALGDLDDEGRLRVDAAPEQAHGLLGIVDVVRADGVLAVGVLEELRGGDDHGKRPTCASAAGPTSVFTERRPSLALAAARGGRRRGSLAAAGSSLVRGAHHLLHLLLGLLLLLDLLECSHLRRREDTRGLCERVVRDLARCRPR